MLERTYELKYPVEFRDENITTLTFKRLKGKHMAKLGTGDDFARNLKLASRSSEMPPQFFDEVDGEDLMNIFEVVGDFLGAGQ